MQNLEWYLADLKYSGKNAIETVEKSLTDMFIRLVRIYPCLLCILRYIITCMIIRAPNAAKFTVSLLFYILVLFYGSYIFNVTQLRVCCSS